MTPFEKAFAEARASRQSSFEFPPGSGRTYSTETMEDRQRKAYADTSRGRDVPARKAEAPAAPPAPRARASLSDIPRLVVRGMAEGVDRVPPGRGQGQMFVAAGAGKAAQAAVKAGAQAAVKAAQAPRAAAPAAKRVEPLLYTSRGEKGKFVPGGSPKGGAKVPERQDPPMYKKGGLVTKGTRRG